MKYCCHGGQMPAYVAKRMLELASAMDKEDEDENGSIEMQVKGL
jgi:hypothetical protein